MEEPPVFDGAPINKDTSEVKTAGLGEDPLIGPLPDGEIQAVEEEEKKGDDELPSDVPQAKQVEFDQVMSEPL